MPLAPLKIYTNAILTDTEENSDTMEPLEKEFRKNDMNYKILERSETRYFAELRSTESGNIVAYETGRILKQEGTQRIIDGKTVEYKAKELIVSNEKFGSDEFECCMNPKNESKVHAAFLEATEFDKNKQL